MSPQSKQNSLSSEHPIGQGTEGIEVNETEDIYPSNESNDIRMQLEQTNNDSQTDETKPIPILPWKCGPKQRIKNINYYLKRRQLILQETTSFPVHRSRLKLVRSPLSLHTLGPFLQISEELEIKYKMKDMTLFESSNTLEEDYVYNDSWFDEKMLSDIYLDPLFNGRRVMFSIRTINILVERCILEENGIENFFDGLVNNSIAELEEINYFKLLEKLYNKFRKIAGLSIACIPERKREPLVIHSIVGNTARSFTQNMRVKFQKLTKSPIRWIFVKKDLFIILSLFEYSRIHYLKAYNTLNV